MVRGCLERCAFAKAACISTGPLPAVFKSVMKPKSFGMAGKPRTSWWSERGLWGVYPGEQQFRVRCLRTKSLFRFLMNFPNIGYFFFLKFSNFENLKK